VIKTLEPALLARLKKLQKTWRVKKPVTIFNQLIFPFREMDHQTLDRLIKSIEEEGLDGRFLMPKEPRLIENIYDSELTREIYKIFFSAFAPHDLRGMWN
jgi:hypothetical protein